MKPTISITQKYPLPLSAILTNVLADVIVLYIKTRKVHSFLKADDAKALEQLFMGQYRVLENSIEEITNRKLQLGEPIRGNLKDYIEHSSLDKTPALYFDIDNMLTELLHDHELISRNLRKHIDEFCEKQNNSYCDTLINQYNKHEYIAGKIRIYLINQGKFFAPKKAC